MQHMMTPELLIPFVQSLPGCKVQPGLYLVATPIGHLSDISLRALAVLSQVDLVACEDTRVTSKLLSAYGIKKTLITYHDHNASVASQKIVDHIHQGNAVALVSDAGTPLISDPGFNLVNDCIANNLYVTSIPGASAAVTALTLSGLPSDNFMFVGFLPPKSAARRKGLSEIAHYPTTLILYEAPHRIIALLEDIHSELGDRNVVVCRELTKKFEETQRGSAAEILARMGSSEPRGEFVVLIDGAKPKTPVDISDEEILNALISMKTKEAAGYFSQTYGVSQKEIYARIINLKK
jgi:16S rRNA (cytidine1402-2'-O)-methyltransferase